MTILKITNYFMNLINVIHNNVIFLFAVFCGY